MKNEPLDLRELLHDRVWDECAHLLVGKQFKHAALEAMKQVELALAERGLTPRRVTGRRLVKQTLGGAGLITLSVPLGEDLQNEAQQLFEGAFVYYRNYAAHDGSRINRTIAIRIMVLASELLDLVATSPRSLTNLGGIPGLIERGLFKSASHLASTLRFFDGVSFPDTAPDGFLYDMANADVSDQHLELLFDLGLIDWQSSPPSCINKPLVSI